MTQSTTHSLIRLREDGSDPTPAAAQHQGERNQPDLSTKMLACTAYTMLLKRGLSSLLRTASTVCRVKVEASHSRTSDGTESDWKLRSSSSGSTSCLRRETGAPRGELKYKAWRCQWGEQSVAARVAEGVTQN